MISSYRAGVNAGSSAHQSHPVWSGNIMQLAKETLERRKRLGIAHFIPEQDFLRGFVEGYEQHTAKPDGLCLQELELK